MNNKIRDMLIFAAGIAVGYFIGAKAMQSNAEEAADDQSTDISSSAIEAFDNFKKAVSGAVDSVRSKEKVSLKDAVEEEYENMIDQYIIDESEVEDDKLPDELAKKNREKPDILSYAEKSDKQRRPTPYVRQSPGSRDLDKELYDEYESEFEDENAEPYVISPEEFGLNDEYDILSWTYYADGLLVDDAHQIVDDVVRSVGPRALDSFGEYEADSVFVRNDALKCDIEILLDPEPFVDVLRRRPDYIDMNER